MRPNVEAGCPGSAGPAYASWVAGTVFVAGRDAMASSNGSTGHLADARARRPTGVAPLGWTYDLRGQGPAATRFAVLGAHAADLLAEMGDLLCAVRGYAQLLAAEAKTDPGTTARQILRVIDGGTDLCARFEAHIAGAPPPESEFDFNGLVVCALDLVRDFLGRDIRLQFDPGQGPLHVRGRCARAGTGRAGAVVQCARCHAGWRSAAHSHNPRRSRDAKRR